MILTAGYKLKIGGASETELVLQSVQRPANDRVDADKIEINSVAGNESEAGNDIPDENEEAKGSGRLAFEVSCEMTDQGSLEYLSLDCPKVLDGGLKQVLDRNPRLEKFFVPGCVRFTAECISDNLDGDNVPGWISFTVFEQEKLMNKHLREWWPYVKGAVSVVVDKMAFKLIGLGGFMITEVGLYIDNRADIDLDCWPLMSVAIKVIDTTLGHDFGFVGLGFDHLLHAQRGTEIDVMSLRLVFEKTKKRADSLEHRSSGNGFPAATIHGDSTLQDLLLFSFDTCD